MSFVFFMKVSLIQACLTFFTFLGQVTAQESLFYYGAGLSTGNYSNPDFVPSFKSDVVANAPDMITTYCGDNTECIFDYSVSGSEDVAAETILADQNYVSQENQACMFNK